MSLTTVADRLLAQISPDTSPIRRIRELTAFLAQLEWAVGELADQRRQMLIDLRKDYSTQEIADALGVISAQRISQITGPMPTKRKRSGPKLSEAG